MNRRTEDPDVYPGTDILRNLQDIQDPSDLETLEVQISAVALARLAKEPLPGRYDLEHLAAFHSALFEEIYPFAGRIRSIPLTKPEISLQGRSVAYAAPEDISIAAEEGFKALRSGNWSKLGQRTIATRFTTAVAIAWQAHPFRDGNTRTMMALVRQLARERGSSLDFGVLSSIPNETRNALALATEGNTGGLQRSDRPRTEGGDRESSPRHHRSDDIRKCERSLELLGNPEIHALAPYSIATGRVLATSYQTVLLRSGAGITAVSLRNFTEIPVNETQVMDLAVRYAIGSAPRTGALPERAHPLKKDGPGL